MARATRGLEKLEGCHWVYITTHLLQSKKLPAFPILKPGFTLVLDGAAKAKATLSTNLIPSNCSGEVRQRNKSVQAQPSFPRISLKCH